MRTAQAEIRKLVSGDEDRLDAFLAAYTETSIFLRSNMRKAGIAWKDAPHHGEYLGAVLPDGTVKGVLVHYWNGNIMMQAPDGEILRELIAAFRTSATRPVAGMLGEDAQAGAVISGLGLEGAEFAINSSEKLYTLDLQDLKIPETGNLRLLPAKAAGRDLLAQWLRAYNIEALGAADDAGLDREISGRVDRSVQDHANSWVLEANGAFVAHSGFNARLPDVVQIGPVWTPPAERGKGYARAIVALSLREAVKEDVKRAVLFTDNPPAIRAYEALGFRHAGAFRLALLKSPVAV